jgi:hypothetical protein
MSFSVAAIVSKEVRATADKTQLDHPGQSNSGLLCLTAEERRDRVVVQNRVRLIA